MYVLPDLPYAHNALEPVISERTLHIHHGRHHAGYVKTLNEELVACPSDAQTLEDVIRFASKTGQLKLFNNAAQAWNHSFFWAAMAPKCALPREAFASAIDQAFGDIHQLKAAFVEAGAAHFGSGWVWLEADQAGFLGVRSTHDADDTLSRPGTTPLLVCDLWEHAYYLDHQNDRRGFLSAWFDTLPNWSLAAQQFEVAHGRAKPWRHPAPHDTVAVT